MPVVLTVVTDMNARIGKVKSIELLGYKGELKWEPHGDGLQVHMPKDLPSDYAHGLKIQLEDK